MKRLPVIAAAFVALLPGVSQAAVYRCPDGSFQDKPCDKGDSKVVTRRNTAGAPKPSEDLCAAYGQSAAEIARARADGATSDALFADIDRMGLPPDKKLSRKKLVAEVFQKSGTPREIAVLYEADCAKARDQAARQAPARPAVESRGGDASVVDPRKREAEARIAADEAKEAAGKEACDKLMARRDHNTSMQRRGGDPAAMERLRQERAGLDGQIFKAGCRS